jgi:hypothetical protein
MTRTVNWSAYVLLMLGLTGCPSVDHPGSEFATGVPRRETVAMNVPGSSVKALTVEDSSKALQGETSEWYRTTRAVTGVVNGGAVAVGSLVRLITDYPATSVAANSAVWGPWQGPLDPVEWKITVTRVAPHQYQYAFEGRDKQDAAAPFVTVLSGSHSPGLDLRGMELEGFGSGSFLLDWDARARLPGPDGNVGTAAYTYSRLGPEQVADITARFRQVKDEDQPGRLVDVDYAFTQKPGADGSMDFLYDVPADATRAGGLGKVRSRWLWNGAGRSDASVVPTNLDLTYTVSECWDTSYLSIYRSVPLSTAAADNYGSESFCAFPTAEFSKL